jgi:hypothetical protein
MAEISRNPLKNQSALEHARYGCRCDIVQGFITNIQTTCDFNILLIIYLSLKINFEYLYISTPCKLKR